MEFERTIVIGRLTERPTAFGAKAGRKSHSGVRFRISRDGREHPITAFGKLADKIFDNLNKGDLCLIEGRVTKWANMQGIARKKYPSIIADNVVFCSRKEA